MKADHQSKHYQMEDRLHIVLPKEEAETNQTIEGLKQDIAARDQSDVFSMRIGKALYTDKNVLTKETINLTRINKWIPEDRWKNIQSPFMRPDWASVHELRRGEWLKIGGCPFPSGYFTLLSYLRSQEEGEP